ASPWGAGALKARLRRARRAPTPSSLRTRASDPASKARSSAPFSSEEERSRQGVLLSAASRRIRRMTVAPPTVGRAPSTRRASGGGEVEALRPVGGGDHLVAGREGAP